MRKERVVLFTAPSDQGDILQDFLDWHLDLGIDMILAMDHGSTDGSRELLERYAKTHPVVWFPIPERNITKYSPADELAALARDRYGADWIIHCDVDEFLCTSGGDLRTILARARPGRADADQRAAPHDDRRSAAGRTAGDAGAHLADRPGRGADSRTTVSWDLPAPFAFLEVGGHLIVRAAAFDRYGPGAHVGTTTSGLSGTVDDLYILHYAMRGFESLRIKVRNTASWLESNRHLEPGMCWHWRRWIHLEEQGRLREDYDQQFVSPERARELVQQGICVVDETVARWLEQKATNARRRPTLWSRLAKATINPLKRQSR